MDPSSIITLWDYVFTTLEERENKDKEKKKHQRKKEREDMNPQRIGRRGWRDEDDDMMMLLLLPYLDALSFTLDYYHHHHHQSKSEGSSTFSSVDLVYMSTLHCPLSMERCALLVRICLRMNSAPYYDSTRRLLCAITQHSTILSNQILKVLLPTTKKKEEKENEMSEQENQPSAVSRGKERKRRVLGLLLGCEPRIYTLAQLSIRSYLADNVNIFTEIMVHKKKKNDESMHESMNPLVNPVTVVNTCRTLSSILDLFACFCHHDIGKDYVRSSVDGSHSTNIFLRDVVKTLSLIDVKTLVSQSMSLLDNMMMKKMKETTSKWNQTNTQRIVERRRERRLLLESCYERVLLSGLNFVRTCWTSNSQNEEIVTSELISGLSNMKSLNHFVQTLFVNTFTKKKMIMKKKKMKMNSITKLESIVVDTISTDSKETMQREKMTALLLKGDQRLRKRRYRSTHNHHGSKSRSTRSSDRSMMNEWNNLSTEMEVSSSTSSSSSSSFSSSNSSSENGSILKYAHGSTQQYICSVGSHFFNQGYHEWEITLLGHHHQSMSGNQMKDTFIGLVSRSSHNHNNNTPVQYCGSTQTSWGYYANNGHAYHVQSKNYGVSYKEGDVIIMRLSLPNHHQDSSSGSGGKSGNTLSYSVNGIDQGIAYSDLPSFDQNKGQKTKQNGYAPSIALYWPGDAVKVVYLGGSSTTMNQKEHKKRKSRRSNSSHRSRRYYDSSRYYDDHKMDNEMDDDMDDEMDVSMSIVPSHVFTTQDMDNPFYNLTSISTTITDNTTNDITSTLDGSIDTASSYEKILDKIAHTKNGLSTLLSLVKETLILSQEEEEEEENEEKENDKKEKNEKNEKNEKERKRKVLLNSSSERSEDRLEKQQLWKWLSLLEGNITLPGFAQAFLCDPQCKTLLLKALDYHDIGETEERDERKSQKKKSKKKNQKKSKKKKQKKKRMTILDLLEDPLESQVSALHQLFHKMSTTLNQDRSKEGSKKVSKERKLYEECYRTCLKSGVIDRLLLRLGELQNETPRDTTHTSQFEDPLLVQQRIEIEKEKYKKREKKEKKNETTTKKKKKKSSEKEKEKSAALWTPGYGTNNNNDASNNTSSSNSLSSEEQKEMEKQKKERKTISTLNCLTSFLNIHIKEEEQSSFEIDYNLYLKILDSSSLLKIFLSYLFGNTTSGIYDQCSLFLSIFHCLTAISKHDQLLPLLMDRESLYKSIFLLMTENQELLDEMKDDEKDRKHQNNDDYDDDDLEEESEGKSEKVLLREEELRVLFESTIRTVTSRVIHYKNNIKKKKKKEKEEQMLQKKNSTKDQEEQEGETKSTSSSSSTLSIEVLYRQRMKKHVFSSMALNTKKHHYNTSIQSDLKKSKKRSRKLKKDLKQLKKDLPLEYGSSIFVRIDKTRPHMLNCVITGPADTPYDSGVFLFDVYCPTTFPEGPPKVNLQTTGSGQVRFNPNLYNCGKVCLSLLGTWQGGAHGKENWDSKMSTLWQVFVSIQGQILGSQYPYFNEPSIEAQWGTCFISFHS